MPSSGWAASDTTEPLAHFPPGFSTAIAAPVALGLPPIQSARLIVALSAFASAAIIYLLIASATSPLAAALAAAAAIVTPALVSVHLAVLSEPLFLVTVLATLAAMTATSLAASPITATPRSSAVPALLTGLAAAAAASVRYVGVAFVAAAVLWTLAQRGPWSRRLRDAALAGVPATIVLGLWIVRSTRAAGKQGIRKFGSYGRLGYSLREALDTLTRWLAPHVSAAPWRALAAVAAVLATVAIAIGGMRVIHRRADPAGRMLAAIGVLAMAYAGILVMSRLFADPNIPFDDRILAPLILLIELAVAIAAWGWWHASAGRWTRRAAAAGLAVWLVGSVSVSRGLVSDALTDGDDFAATQWRYSPTVAWVRANAPHTPLFTNWPVALYFHAGRGSHILPAGLDPLTLRRFAARVSRAGGIIVGFDTPSVECAPPDSIASRLRLRPLARLADGTIWAVGD